MVIRHPESRFNWMRASLPVLALAAALPLALHLAAACVFADEDSSGQMVDTLHAAVNAYDVDRTVGLFADDAVVVQPRIGGLPQVYVGQDQIRWWQRRLVGQHVHIELAGVPRLAGTHVRWTDHFSVDAFRDLGLEVIDIDSDAVLSLNGRIQSLIGVLTPEAARSLQAAPGGATSLPDAPEESLPGNVVLATLLIGAGFLGGAAGACLLSRRRILLRTRRPRAAYTSRGPR
jgi:hypothetical protein